MAARSRQIAIDEVFDALPRAELLPLTQCSLQNPTNGFRPGRQILLVATPVVQGR